MMEFFKKKILQMIKQRRCEQTAKKKNNAKTQGYPVDNNAKLSKRRKTYFS